MIDRGEFILGVQAVWCRKCVVYHRELTPPLWSIIPAGRNHIPNAVVQPSLLTWVRWAGWSVTGCDVVDPITLATAIGYYTREDLIIAG